MVAAKKLLIGLGAFALLLLGGFAMQQHRGAAQDSAAWALARRALIQLNDSTVARFAAQSLKDAHAKDSLQALLTAAKQVHGTLIAGVRIAVAARDTVILHDTLATVTSSDSVRTAIFRDSTFAGVVSGTVVAPKCCTALTLDLRVHRPEFHPEVGFIQVGDQVAAIVSWQGEQARIENAFALPRPPVPGRIVPWVEGTYNLASAARARAGVDLRVLGVRVGPSIEADLGAFKLPTIGVTLRKEW